MSHKTTIKTQLTNKGYLVEALQKMGLQCQIAATENGLETKGRYNVKEKVDILITGNGTDKFDAIGFQMQADGTYTAIGDFYGLRDANGKSLSMEFLKEECTALAKETEIIDHLAQLDFTQADRIDNGKEITLTLSRWVP